MLCNIYGLHIVAQDKQSANAQYVFFYILVQKLLK